MTSMPVPIPSAKERDEDFHDYVLRRASPYRNLLDLDLEPCKNSCRKPPRRLRILLPNWLGPFPDLRPGAPVRLYGDNDGGIGWPFRGIDVAGREVFYRPLADTVEGWWREVSSRKGHEDEVLYRYRPPRRRTFLPGAPKEVSLTRRCLTVKMRGGGTDRRDVFSLYDYLSSNTMCSRWAFVSVGIYLPLLVILFLAPPATLAGSLATVVALLAGSVLSRTEALYLYGPTLSGHRITHRLYPLLGRDPGLQDLIRNRERFHAFSQKCYYREHLYHPRFDGPTKTGEEG